MIDYHQVKLALQLADFDAVAAQLKMIPYPRPIQRPMSRSGNPRLAAVLILLYPHHDDLHFALIERNQYEGVHSGQISLPGGQREPDEALATTALRETFEEVGVPPSEVELLGELTTIYIPPSDFEVHPYVGYTTTQPQWQPDPHEVADLIEAPLQCLFDDNLKQVGAVPTSRGALEAPYYAISGRKVWGATAIILSEFEQRLRLTLDR